MAEKYGIEKFVGSQRVREENKTGGVIIVQTAKNMAIKYNLSHNAARKIMAMLSASPNSSKNIEKMIMHVTDLMRKLGKRDYEISEAVTNILKTGADVPEAGYINDVVAVCMNEGVPIEEIFGKRNPFTEKMELDALYALLKLVKKTDPEANLYRVIKVGAKLQKEDIIERAKRMFPLTKKTMFMAHYNFKEKLRNGALGRAK